MGALSSVTVVQEVPSDQLAPCRHCQQLDDPLVAPSDQPIRHVDYHAHVVGHHIFARIKLVPRPSPMIGSRAGWPTMHGKGGSKHQGDADVHDQAA